ncbi:MAG: gluconate 2-dehydrogenase subunit 3 family protein [Pseudomonadota bacterium]
MSAFKLSRRETIASLLAISTSGALAACSANETRSQADPDLDFATPTTFFTEAEMVFFSAVANTIIPDTETAGAVGAGVPETIQDLASVWGDNNYRRYWRVGLRELNKALKASSGESFLDIDRASQQKALVDYDAKVFDGSVQNGFYRDLKSTVIDAYYKSEIGASQELAYEPVPGEWIGCVPLSDFPKTWAT